MDLVNEQISSATTTTDHFNFQIVYFIQNWGVPKFHDFLSNQTVDNSALRENLQLDDHTTFCIELTHYEDTHLSADLLLLKCKHDRIRVWCRVAVLDKDGQRFESHSTYLLVFVMCTNAFV